MEAASRYRQERAARPARVRGPLRAVADRPAIGWRRRHGAPALPDSISLRLQGAARINHGLLYVLLFLLPLSGWTMVSAAGIAPWLLGIVPLATLLGRQRVQRY